MRAWEAIQKSVDEIEEHIQEHLDITTLADRAGLSPFYFQRLFTELIGRPVQEYIKLRRLAHAAEALTDPQQRVMDIAYRFGFSDPANFTRAFKNAYYITPEAYRHQALHLNHFIKPDLSLNYTNPDENASVISDGMVFSIHQETLDHDLHFRGLSGLIPGKTLSSGKVTGVAKAGEIWENFHAQKPSIPGIHPDGEEIAILTLAAEERNMFPYFTGAQVDDPDPSDTYQNCLLPGGAYLVCHFEAETFPDLVNIAMVKALLFLDQWIENHHQSIGDKVYERYSGKASEVSGMEIWLPLIEVKSIPAASQSWDILDASRKPDMQHIHTFVQSSYFERLTAYLEETYRLQPQFEYSRCSMQRGWNIKYKKSGKTACTIYPEQGQIIVLIVIGKKEREAVEIKMPDFSPYFQRLYHETKVSMEQRWLMLEITDDDILADVQTCIDIRIGKKKR